MKVLPTCQLFQYLLHSLCAVCPWQITGACAKVGITLFKPASVIADMSHVDQLLPDFAEGLNMTVSPSDKGPFGCNGPRKDLLLSPQLQVEGLLRFPRVDKVQCHIVSAPSLETVTCVDVHVFDNWRWLRVSVFFKRKIQVILTGWRALESSEQLGSCCGNPAELKFTTVSVIPVSIMDLLPVSCVVLVSLPQEKVGHFIFALFISFALRFPFENDHCHRFG